MLAASEILIAPVILAALGSFVANLLNLLELPHIPKERRPDLRDPLYWVAFVVWPILGGIVGYLYNDTASPLGKLVAFHLGISAPLILKTMANVLPTQARQALPTGS